MYLLVLLFPFLGFCFCSLFGRFLGKKGVVLLICSFIFFSFISAFFIFYEVILSNSSCFIELKIWFFSGSLTIKWNFLFDSLTSIMLIVILSISLLVHVYSISYMNSDPHIIRFMNYLSLFTLFMLILVTAGNFVQMFLGWEGVGLTSYLLINFWFTRVNANKSAIKAIILNRIGDFGLLIGLTLLAFFFKSIDYFVIFSLANSFFSNQFFGFDLLSFICFFLFIGAVGKSAQLGLHSWLPDAMEGPTPVSALIHAATMVTAGVFLILRCSPIFEFSNFLILIGFIGGLTSFFAATVGAFQNDLKKVIAYSTCSQLGYMIFACGFSQYSVSLFHLMNHAFFKALLFLSAGAVIHALNDEQDMRRMGSLISFLPVCYVMFLIGSLSLMGFPFLAGFYSKDMLLELTFANFSVNSFFVYWLGILSALFTAFYSIRLILLTFIVKFNGFRCSVLKIHESSIIIVIVLSFLCCGSLFSGYFLKEFFVGMGTNVFTNSLFSFFVNEFESEFLTIFWKNIPVFFTLLGSAVAVLVNRFFFSNGSFVFFYLILKKLYLIFNNKLFFDVLYNKSIGYLTLMFGYKITLRMLDRGLFELFGPLGVVRVLSLVSFIVSKISTNFFFHFLLNGVYFVIFISFILYFLYFFYIFSFFKFLLMIFFSFYLFFIFFN